MNVKRLTCLVTLFWLIPTASCSTSSNSESTYTPSTVSTPSKSVERMLAELDSIYGKGDPVINDDDIRVKRIRYLVNSISAKTEDTPYDVANLTSKYTQMIRDEYGRQINNQARLEYANEFVSTAPKMKYKDVCSIVSLQLNK
jgi:Txe/YoeB family toxin of Txe-Axe toxin-antitoxin module